MTKHQFIERLRAKLNGLPKKDIDERIAFYIEIIDDKIEEGATEESAVSQIGSVDEIAGQIIADTPISKIVKEKFKPHKKLQTWEIVLLVLGFPLWFPLLISVFAVAISVYVVVWSVVISLWAVVVSLVVSAIGVFVAGIVFFCTSYTVSGVFAIAGAMVCAGLGIFAFFGCTYATKEILVWTKRLVVGVKNRLLNKEKSV